MLKVFASDVILTPLGWAASKRITYNGTRAKEHEVIPLQCQDPPHEAKQKVDPFPLDTTLPAMQTRIP